MKARKKHASDAIANDVGTTSKCWLLLQISHNVKDEKRQMRNLETNPSNRKHERVMTLWGPARVAESSLE